MKNRELFASVGGDVMAWCEAFLARIALFSKSSYVEVSERSVLSFYLMYWAVMNLQQGSSSLGFDYPEREIAIPGASDEEEEEEAGAEGAGAISSTKPVPLELPSLS